MDLESILNVLRLISANWLSGTKIQFLFIGERPNAKYVGDMDCSNGYTIIVPDIFVGQGL